MLATRPDGGPASPGTIVAFEGRPGELALAYTPGEPRGARVGRPVSPIPGPGNVYELWMIEDDATPSAARASPRTDGAVAAYLDADLSSAELMAVTVESAECPDAPTTDPVYTAELRLDRSCRLRGCASASRRTIGRMPPWPKIATSAA